MFWRKKKSEGAFFVGPVINDPDIVATFDVLYIVEDAENVRRASGLMAWGRTRDGYARSLQRFDLPGHWSIEFMLDPKEVLHG
jgi:hypothetical protein